MRTEVARWGNSLAVRLPRQVLEQAHITEGTAVDLDVEDGRVVISPATPRYDLADLLAGITADNLPDDCFDDPARGQEAL